MGSKTSHAINRMQQRGLPDFIMGIVEECGRMEHAPGGVYRMFLGKRDIHELRHKLKRVIQMLDKACGVTMIIDGDTLITTYKARR